MAHRVLLVLISLRSMSEAGNCEKPTLTTRQYSVSPEADYYAAGYEFVVICQFGYRDTAAHLITCQPGGAWRGTRPVCNNYYPDLALPWWGLFILICSLTVFITSTSPRLWIWISSIKKRASVVPAMDDKLQVKQIPCQNIDEPKPKPWFRMNKVQHGIPSSELPLSFTKQTPPFHLVARDNLSF